MRDEDSEFRKRQTKVGPQIGHGAIVRQQIARFAGDSQPCSGQGARKSFSDRFGDLSNLRA